MNITFGFINETNDVENRVAITPDVAKRLLKTLKLPSSVDSSSQNQPQNLQNEQNIQRPQLILNIESGAGNKSNFTDNDYVNAGVNVVDRITALQSDYVGFLDAPNDLEISQMKSGAVAIGLFNSLANEKIAQKFIQKGITAIDMNLLPRQLSMAQSMDAMTSQASVAGYKAVLLAANEFPAFFPMMTTAAGTIKPATVLVLGAGIAGLQAIGTAKRLGGAVTAYDVRATSREEIESVGGKFLELKKYALPENARFIDSLTQSQGEGGYARALSEDEINAQKQATDLALKDFDIVITTASVPGRKPPQFISQNGISNMKCGSVIVDLAAGDFGGNVEGSVANKTVEINGVKVIGAPNLASSAPTSASNLIARNISDVFAYFVTNTFAENFVNYTGFGELLPMIITGEDKITTQETSFNTSLENQSISIESEEK